MVLSTVGGGFTNSAIAIYASICGGQQNLASGTASHVGGGTSNIASGTNSTAFGLSTNANSIAGVHIHGQFGIARSTPASSAYSFQLAGGVASGLTGISGQDGIGLILRTNTTGINPTTEGIADLWTTGGFDYAEMFEWADGNPDNEYRPGYFVDLQGDKIILSTGNTPIGITTATSGVIGDVAEMCWKGALKRDEFGKLLTEDDYAAPIRDIVTSPEARALTFTKYDVSLIENVVAVLKDETEIAQVRAVQPAKRNIPGDGYKPNVEYIPRSQRKEWISVGLMGKLYVRDDGKCSPGGFCDCKDGIAIPGSTYRVMTRNSDNVVKILFK